MVYMPIVLTALRGLWILQKVMDNAFLNHDGVAWRNVQGEMLGQLPVGGEGSGEFDGVLVIGQRKMNSLVLGELEKYPCVQVKFGQRVVGLEDIDQST